MTRLAHAPKAVKLAALRARLGRADSYKFQQNHMNGAQGPIPDPDGSLTDIAPEAYLDGPAAFAFLIALLARCAAARPGPILLALPGRAFDFGLPDPASAAAWGVAPDRLILARARDARGALWAMEEAASVRGMAAAAGAGLTDGAYGLLASRRLALAAERTGVPVLALRSHAARAPSAARRRWRIGPAAASPAPWLGATGLPGLGARRWRVALERAPSFAGAARAQAGFEVEWNDAALRFDPAAGLADGQGAPAVLRDRAA